jgi:hypothetical protein
MADVMTRYYALNFVRKPEFMGFNGYSDAINHAAFNPLAWGDPAYPESFDQNDIRLRQWGEEENTEKAIAMAIAPKYSDAFFELVGYPVEASAAMNRKFLWADRSFSDLIPWAPDSMGPQGSVASRIASDSAEARAAYNTILTLTAKYNSIAGGKWDGMMDAAPRRRPVFEMPRTATLADADLPLPVSWGSGIADISSTPSQHILSTTLFVEQSRTVSINAAHVSRSSAMDWHILFDLGVSGDAIVYGSPGMLANTDIATATSGPQTAPWLDYDFTTTSNGPATLALHLLPTFPVDSDHRMRYAVSLDGAAPVELDAAASATKKSASAGDGPTNSGWAENVLRNSAIATIPLGPLAPGRHTLRLLYRDPGVVFEHLVITFPGAPPAYPVPPETR